MAIGTPVPQDDIHPSVYMPQTASNVVPAEDLHETSINQDSTLHPESAYPALGAGAALAAQGLGRIAGSKNWFNSDFPEYQPSEPNPLPKNPGEFTEGVYKPGAPYKPGIFTPGKPYAPGPEFVRREFPGLSPELDKGPNSVENYSLTQHKGPEGEGQFFGGKDYEDAYAKAMEAKQFNANNSGFVVPQGGTSLALPPEVAAQKEQEYKDKLAAERAQREQGARVMHEQSEDQRQAEHNRTEAARRQAHEDREAHRLRTFNDIEKQREANHAKAEQERQSGFLASNAEKQNAHATRQAEFQLAKRAEDARMAQEANRIAKAKLIGAANKLPGQLPMAGWNAGEAAERFQEPGIRNKIAGAINSVGAAAPLLSHIPKIGKYAGLIGPGAAAAAHFIADEPQGHKNGGHIQHFGRGGQPNQGEPLTTDRVVNDVKSFGAPLTALGDTLASGLRSSTAATLGAPSDIYNLASAVTGDRLGHAPYGSEELKQMLPEVTNDPARMNSNLVKMASAAGDWTPLAGPGEIARGIKGVGKLAGSEINKAMMGEGNNMLRAITPQPLFAAPMSKSAVDKVSGYLHHTNINPNPLVGNRFKTEDLGGLMPIKPTDLESMRDAMIHTKPWDLTSRNKKIVEVSGKPLTADIVSHGGQSYARDLEHMKKGIGGASALPISNRIQNITDIASQEGQKLGGSGRVIMSPSTMSKYSEDYAIPTFDTYKNLWDQVEPGEARTEALLQKLKFENPKKLKSQTPVPFVGMIPDIKYPFNDLKSLNFNDPDVMGRFLQTPDLRKALIKEWRSKENQRMMDYNAEDLSAAHTDPNLRNIPPAFSGHTMIEMAPGAKPTLSSNITYDTDFAGNYLGSIGHVPTPVLLNKSYTNINNQMRKLHPGEDEDTLHRLTMGALYTRNEGVSDLVNDEMINRVGAYQDAVKAGKIPQNDYKSALDYLNQPSAIPGEKRNYADGGLVGIE